MLMSSAVWSTVAKRRPAPLGSSKVPTWILGGWIDLEADVLFKQFVSKPVAKHQEMGTSG